MRSAPKSEQEKKEIEAAERQERRKGGFELMDARDRGWGKLSNGAVMLWQVPKESRQEGVPYTNIPDNAFCLVLDGKTTIFDGEEFRRWLRWV